MEVEGKHGMTVVATFLGTALVCCIPALGWSGTAYSPAWKSELLGITYWVPPITAYLEDAAGRKLGNHPSSTVSADGEGSRISEYPSADISVHSEGDEDREGADVPAPSAWVLKVYDGGVEPYDLHIRGLQPALTTIKFRLSIRGSSGSTRIPPVKKSLLVSSGSSHVLQVRPDGSRGLLSIERRVSTGNLFESVKVAHTLRLIEPEGIYQSLLAKAEAIAKSSTAGRESAMQGLVKAFLSELHAQSGKHIDPKAIEILREVAEALLNLRPPRKSKARARPAPTVTAQPMR